MGLLTHTSKMACPSFGLPVGETCPALSKCLESDANGGEAICRQCYAQKGRYAWRNVRKSLETRLAWWRPRTPRERAETLAAAMHAEGDPSYFRCYDSGDLEDDDAMDTWLILADLLPRTKLWLPSRTWVLDDGLARLRRLNEHPRIVVRPSALKFGDPPPHVEGLAAGTTAPVTNDAIDGLADRTCLGTCGDCRDCWEAPTTSVAYHRK